MMALRNLSARVALARRAPEVPASRAKPAKKRPLSASSHHAATVHDSQMLTLPDGRKLGFAEYGDPTGEPVFFFHGCPSSRLEVASLAQQAAKLNARIISPDRPGIGLSSSQTDRRLIDWPSDVQHLAKSLHLDSYRIIGASGGGPYALACASLLPKTSVKAVGILAGMGPREGGLEGQNWANRSMMYLTVYMPWLLRYMAKKMVSDPLQVKSEEELLAMLDKYLSKLSAEERSSFEKEPEAKETLLRVMKESFRQGVDGYMQECTILSRPWGFALEEIDVPKAIFWYARQDRNTPLSMGKYMADRVPGAALREYSDDNHYNVGAHFEENLRELLER